MNNIVSPSFQVETKIGELNVVTHGIVHVSENRSLTIKVLDLEFTFLFINDTGENRWEAIVTGKAITFNVFNSNNPLGSGVLEPIKLCKVNEKDLSMTFYVWTPDRKASLRLLSYVFYIN